jgi:hypothetical protein
MLGVDPALDRMAAELDVALAEAQLLAGGDADLLLDDVDAGDHLGHRMLDLDARVHLDEVELAVLVQELERAGAAIADLRQASAQRSPMRSIMRGGDARCRRLFDAPSGGGAASSSRVRRGRRRCLCSSASTWISM